MQQILRFFIAILNLALIALTAYVGFLTFVARVPVPPKERPPAGFDPTRFDIKEEIKNPRNIAQYRPIWTTWRPAPPPPPVVVARPSLKLNPVKAAPILPPVQRMYQLNMASINKTNPERSTCQLQKKAGGQIHVVKVGEEIPDTGFTLVGLADGSAGTVVATLKDKKSGKSQEIKLKPTP